jgi:DNA-binding beta-propeller fold protein YncE
MIDLGRQATGPLAITPDGSTVFVLERKARAVVPVEVATHFVGAPISFGEGEEPADAMAVAPDGSMLYVSVGPYLHAIDLSTRKVVKTLQLPSGAAAIAISPDGSTAYAVGGHLIPIDLATWTAGTPIPDGEGAQAIALAPGGATAYVTDDQGSTVTPIDLETDTPESPIAIRYPSTIAIDPGTTSAPAAPGGAPPPSPIDAPAPPLGPPAATALRCRVPRLAGATLTEARKRLLRAHCRVGRVTYRRHSHRRLLAQSAGAGRMLPANTRINLVFADGPHR